jgi:hypothetical protein
MANEVFLQLADNAGLALRREAMQTGVLHMPI